MSILLAFLFFILHEWVDEEQVGGEWRKKWVGGGWENGERGVAAEQMN